MTLFTVSFTDENCGMTWTTQVTAVDELQARMRAGMKRAEVCKPDTYLFKPWMRKWRITDVRTA